MEGGIILKGSVYMNSLLVFSNFIRKSLDSKLIMQKNLIINLPKSKTMKVTAAVLNHFNNVSDVL